MIPRTVSSPLLGRGVTMAKAGVAGFAAAGDQAAVRRLAPIGRAKLVRPRTDSDHARARLPQQRRPARPLARPRTQTRNDRVPIIAGAVGALREAVVAASAVRGRRAIGASIRQSSGRVRKPHRPPRSSKYRYRRQRQPSVPAPRDHFVARSAAATNIRSTRRDVTAQCQGPSSLPTRKCDRKRYKRRPVVPIGDLPTMAVTISQHGSMGRPTHSTTLRRMRTSTAEATERWRTSGRERSEPVVTSR